MSKYLQGDVIGHEFLTQAFVPATAAADATIGHPVFIAPRDVEILEVSIIPQAAVTGADTNTKHLNLRNRGADGTGTTELANYDLTSGNNLSNHDEKSLYAPTTPLAIADGVVLQLEVEKIGTGLATPAFLVATRHRLQ